LTCQLDGIGKLGKTPEVLRAFTNNPFFRKYAPRDWQLKCEKPAEAGFFISML
jgi:hypothetical protein